MSKLSDYSKFDHLPDDSDEDSNAGSSGRGGTFRGQSVAVSSASGPAGAAPTSTSSASTTAAPAPIQTKMTKKNDDGRYVFECNGRKIYEWDQNLEGACV